MFSEWSYVYGIVLNKPKTNKKSVLLLTILSHPASVTEIRILEFVNCNLMT